MPVPVQFRSRIQRSRSRELPSLAAVSVLLFVVGCGALDGGRGWGEDALWPVDLPRVGRAARDALFDRATLAPLAGAAVFAIDDFDNRASDWAVKHTPIFGSTNDARDASDCLKDVLLAEAVVTAVLTPSGDTSGEWLCAKLKGGVVEIGAVAATYSATDLVKDLTDRQRPDRSGDNSFPSAHASASAACATLGNRNLDHLDFLGGARPVLEVVNAVLVTSVGWARVEAGRHHPSDVLVGMALGHFVAAFIHDGFLNLPEDGRVDIDAFASESGAGLALSIRF
ncbi:MAG TPA: phosphatase PAP2 family protein [Sedimentisphaerales bacterium]|jgi:hypothetical protein|nr:phosphatase PAP2 family protein [Sedimentisphaerales bacterium]HNU28017.1 phosphatase PAP2 family protein [Sedimentisphaerales bacterium]